MDELLAALAVLLLVLATRSPTPEKDVLGKLQLWPDTSPEKMLTLRRPQPTGESWRRADNVVYFGDGAMRLRIVAPVSGSVYARWRSHGSYQFHNSSVKCGKQVAGDGGLRGDCPYCDLSEEIARYAGVKPVRPVTNGMSVINLGGVPWWVRQHAKLWGVYVFNVVVRDGRDDTMPKVLFCDDRVAWNILHCAHYLHPKLVTHEEVIAAVADPIYGRDLIFPYGCNDEVDHPQAYVHFDRPSPLAMDMRNIELRIANAHDLDAASETMSPHALMKKLRNRLNLAEQFLDHPVKICPQCLEPFVYFKSLAPDNICRNCGTNKPEPELLADDCKW